MGPMNAGTGPDRLCADLRRLGLSPGDVVLVHSSLSSLGHVIGGAEGFIEALRMAVAPGGTVLVPTLTGRRDLSPANPPVSDPARTPCWTGLVSPALCCGFKAPGIANACDWRL